MSPFLHPFANYLYILVNLQRLNKTVEPTRNSDLYEVLKIFLVDIFMCSVSDASTIKFLLFLSTNLLGRNLLF